jgi:acetyl-CoA C-acetyltransferase
MAKEGRADASWSDIWLLDGVRTPFADYNGALAAVSPTDLGIKAARGCSRIQGVAAGCGRRHHRFDGAGELRHLLPAAPCRSLFGVPIEVPAHMVQRCAAPHRGADAAADCITTRDRSRSASAPKRDRNPVASYTMRGFRMGAVGFKDFLWEALLDPAPRPWATPQKTRASTRSPARRWTPRGAELRPRHRGAEGGLFEARSRR